MRSMTPSFSSLTSPFHSLYGSAQNSLLLRQPPTAVVPPRRRASSPSFPSIVCAANSCNESPLGLQSLRIGDQSPPWLVHPPNGGFSSGGELLFGLHARGSSVGSVPLSLRFLQLKMKMMNLSREMPVARADHLGAIGKAVHSLASAMEEIQQAVLSDDGGTTAAKATVDSVVFLFRNVYFTSPGFVIGLLVLASNFLATSIEKEIGLPAAVDGGGDRCWFDIGILEAGEKRMLKSESDPLGSKRRALAYEKMIASGMTSSLILCNYAQLLYQYERDIERANYYFKWATRQEPVDPEAMNKYATFLWKEIGDLEAAEQMFLAAVEGGPAAYYYESSYAFFLWSTGGIDTCFPIDNLNGEPFD